ncbi:N-terminal kinase-like protein [Podosphaera aphanis]|nr:N-terminal kinase-like protein [Podosphaera aphanis]
MDFLKSAVASAISKSTPLPFTFGDKIDCDTGIWTLYSGTRREDGSNCSIFSFDLNSRKSLLPIARNAVKKLRTLRHPKVIKVLDTTETESHIYIATERVVPLSWYIKIKDLSAETLKWGLVGVAQAIKFINDDASSIHGALRLQSIFTSESGEWKVGGFEVLSCMKDEDAIIFNYGSLVPNVARYTPPELAKSGWDSIKRNPLSAVDAYQYGILIYEVFNDIFTGEFTTGKANKIPMPMQSSFRRLVNINPKARISVGAFLDQGSRHGGFFNTPLIKLTEAIDSLAMKSSEQEREVFLNDLNLLSDDFPEDYFKTKVLQELLKSVEFGEGGPKFLDVVLKIGKKLSNDEFNQKITPVIVRLFGSPDRAIRVCLLDNLPLMIDHLSQKIVNDKLFPHMVTGFTDVAPVVREQTVKAVLTIINKLSDKTINGELLKYLAKTSNDEQPGIRTNTTICLGKISKNLGARTRSKVLIAAFSRSLRDPFVHSRNAALMALAITSDMFNEDDCANRIMPSLCPCLIDKEKLIRDQANKTVDIYLKRIKKFASEMPDSILPPPPPTETSTLSPSLNTQPSDAVSWTGWAISSFTNKVSGVAGDIILNNSTLDPPLVRSSSAPSTATLHCEISNPSPNKLKESSLRPKPLSYSTQTSIGDVGIETDEIWDKDDTFFDAPSSDTKSNATPFDCIDEEPDFAGWLAAQARSKPKSKPLPKGLSRSKNVEKVAPVKSSVKSDNASTFTTKIAPKKIDTTPNDIGDDDDWGNNW